MTDEAKPEKGFGKWLSGASRKDYFENVSLLIIVASAVLVSVGIGLGSFVAGTVLIAVVGAFFVIVGIVLYIISQLIGE